MAKEKAVRDSNTVTLPAKEEPKQVQLTPENAPLFLAKFTEMIVVELRRLNANLEKKNG